MWELSSGYPPLFNEDYPISRYQSYREKPILKLLGNI